MECNHLSLSKIDNETYMCFKCNSSFKVIIKKE